MNQDVVTVVDEQTAKDGKLLAIVAHFFIIGTIASWVLNLSKNNEFTSFYVRQMIGWHILLGLIEGLVYSIFGWFIAKILFYILFFLWVISLIGSFGSNLKLMPVIGEYFQKIFRSL